MYILVVLFSASPCVDIINIACILPLSLNYFYLCIQEQQQMALSATTRYGRIMRVLGQILTYVDTYIKVLVSMMYILWCLKFYW